MSKTQHLKRAGYLIAGILGVAGLCLASVSAEPAHAACGGGVHVGDFYAPCDRGESDDGKISVQVVEVDEEKILKIQLNNYSGGGIKYECCGTCEYWLTDAWSKTIIELTGENEIFEPEGIGINMRDLEFTGDGKLKIEAMIPLGGGDLILPCMPNEAEDGPSYNLPGVDKETIQEIFGFNAVKIDLSNKNTASDSKNDSPNTPSPNASSSDMPDDALIGPTAPKDNSDDTTALVWHIISGIYIGVSLIVFAVLAVKHFIKSKNVATTTEDTNSKPSTAKDDNGVQHGRE